MPTLGKITDLTHQIKLLKPSHELKINAKPYPIPMFYLERAKKQVDQLLAEEVLRPSNSDICSPAFFVPQKMIR